MRGDEADIGASPTLSPTDVEVGAPSPQPIPPELPGDCEDLRGEDQIELKMVDNAFEPGCLIVSVEEVGGGPAVEAREQQHVQHYSSIPFVGRTARPAPVAARITAEGRPSQASATSRSA